MIKSQGNMIFFHLILIILLVFLPVECKKLDIEMHYPVQHMVPAFSRKFVSSVTSDSLTCFGNHDYIEPAYWHTLICMLPLPTQLTSKYIVCDNVWGSRVVVVTVRGSVEFIQLPNLPEESPQGGKYKGTRWLELQSVSGNTEQREIKTIPAEPFYVCARSIDWTGSSSSFEINFRPVYERASDRFLFTRKIILHVILVCAVSSMWLLPYIASFVTCTVVFRMGIDRFFVALVFSVMVVCLTPLMLTKKNRRLAHLYWVYFFGYREGTNREEVINKKELPLFQASFFSCALMCTGTAASYILYSYFGISLEVRNNIISSTMGLSSGWFVFVLCRSFEVFFSKWSWLMLTAFLVQFMDPHINPSSREEAALAVLVITLLWNILLVPHLNLQNLSLSRWGMEQESTAMLHNALSSGERVPADEKLSVTVTVTVEKGKFGMSDNQVFVNNVQTAVQTAVQESLTKEDE